MYQSNYNVNYSELHKKIHQPGTQQVLYQQLLSEYTKLCLISLYLSVLIYKMRITISTG